jgi:hypothetical protein
MNPAGLVRSSRPIWNSTCPRGELRQRGLGGAGEQGADVDRALRLDVDRVALDREVVALERRLGEPDRRAAAHVPLPQVHVAGDHGAVVEALAQRHLLVRADRLEREVLGARVRDH